MTDTAFTVGEQVRSLTDAQGLIAGEVYTVHSVDEQPTVFGIFTTYHLRTGGVVFPVRNAHLLLERV